MASFAAAIDAVQHGMHIARSDWGPGGGRNRRVFMVNHMRGTMPSRLPFDFDKPGVPSHTVQHFTLEPFLVVETSDGKFAPYVPSQEDMAAKDWAIGRDLQNLERQSFDRYSAQQMQRRADQAVMQSMLGAQAPQNPYRGAAAPPPPSSKTKWFPSY